MHQAPRVAWAPLVRSFLHTQMGFEKMPAGLETLRHRGQAAPRPRLAERGPVHRDGQRLRVEAPHEPPAALFGAQQRRLAGFAPPGDVDVHRRTVLGAEEWHLLCRVSKQMLLSLSPRVPGFRVKMAGTDEICDQPGAFYALGLPTPWSTRAALAGAACRGRLGPTPLSASPRVATLAQRPARTW